MYLDVANADEPIYQYYTIVDEPIVVKEDEKPVIYLTFDQTEIEDEAELPQSAVIAGTSDTETVNTISIPNLKVISFNEGEIYVTDNGKCISGP